MANSIFQKDASQYGAGIIAREVHDFYQQSIRVTDADTLLPSSYSNYEITYDSNNRPTSVSYYRALTANTFTLTTSADIAGSLNNKYFRLRSATDDSKYHVWFNVNGAGTDPAPTNSTEIEVALNTNDEASVVATAIVFMINLIAGNKFVATRNSNVVQILNNQLGLVTSPSDFNTGFTVSNVLGTQELVKTINISYDASGSPIYEGNTLNGYTFNINAGKFEKINPEDLFSWANYQIGNKIEVDRTSTPTVLINMLDTNSNVVKSFTAVFTDSTENYLVSLERTL